MNNKYYITEIDNNYISIFKGFTIDKIPKLNKVTYIKYPSEWWRKEFIYERYVKNKNLDWWKRDFINNKFNTDF
tara:strand:+ start:615 stop:836 length:222 start_codon:yes stop_codon:yes gene_type:complete